MCDGICGGFRVGWVGWLCWFVCLVWWGVWGGVAVLVSFFVQSREDLAIVDVVSMPALRVDCVECWRKGGCVPGRRSGQGRSSSCKMCSNWGDTHRLHVALRCFCSSSSTVGTARVWSLSPLHMSSPPPPPFLYRCSSEQPPEGKLFHPHAVPSSVLSPPGSSSVGRFHD